MGIIRSWIRERLILAVKYAIREEIKDSTSLLPQIQINTSLGNDTLKDIDKRIERWTWDRCKRNDRQIENWTWDRWKRIKKEFEAQTGNIAFYSNRIPYYEGEKIRIVFLFQIPSEWPSIESVYNILVKDERFEFTVLLYDRTLGEPEQMAGARKFLIENNILFEEAEYYDFRKKRPHIMFYQTPWDDKHRPYFLRSDAISSLGIRVFYIPYGINYSASVWSDNIFSDVKFRVKPWLMACMSEALKVDHQLMSRYGGHYLTVTGLPKFDSLYYRDRFHLEESLLEEIGNRKIVFVQMHFTDKGGNASVPEPHISEYIDFFDQVDMYKEYYFILRPHPKFFEVYVRDGYEDEVYQFKRIINEKENVYLYDSPDYRPALISADCVIGDRSALLIEAAVLDVPVLYMTNNYYQEQLLPFIKPLFDSYYQGHTAYDMRTFMEYVIISGNDYKEAMRKKATRECIPYFDGKCGERIVDALYENMTLEMEKM
ncbi:CDP-glycerol glycerophosphotransferase family protein [Butyrivibrio sp. AC2005]|uniref:CDP-glycerol glycerophosphotransferase family protein n=1 Tax=Butyrivibrio sp. AC2005 TaxID=1280672 RepID=UPI0004175C42|nr:CDP-glycerol glycerophosphotransferase family protein [Butyrivibrio sp. AC2005]